MRVFKTFKEYLDFYSLPPKNILKGKTRAYIMGWNIAKEACK